MPTLVKSIPIYRKHRTSGQAVASLSGRDFLPSDTIWPLHPPRQTHRVQLLDEVDDQLRADKACCGRVQTGEFVASPIS
jgi:hypothetical protein